MEKVEVQIKEEVDALLLEIKENKKVTNKYQRFSLTQKATPVLIQGISMFLNNHNRRSQTCPLVRLIPISPRYKLESKQ